MRSCPRSQRAHVPQLVAARGTVAAAAVLDAARKARQPLLARSSQAKTCLPCSLSSPSARGTLVAARIVVSRQW